MYKKVNDIQGQALPQVIRKSDGAVIPMDNDNTDYQEYLEWIAKGNTIEEAD